MNEKEKENKRKEALIDYNRANAEIKKIKVKKFKKCLIVFCILVVIVLLIRIFYGKIYYSVSFLWLNKSVEYNLYVNDKHVNVSYEDSEDTPIIPGVFYFRRGNYGGWYNMEKYDEELIFEDEKIELDFLVNECYTHTDKIRVSCDSSNDKLLRKEVKPEFTRLFIRKNGKNEKVMYDGEYISDISKYVSEKGYYYIEIYARYDGIDTKLYITPRRKVSV